MSPAVQRIAVADLTMAYGDNVIQRDINFTVYRGDIFIVMGGSGCGKSTLLRQLVGLNAAAGGDVSFGGGEPWAAEQEERKGCCAGSACLPERRAVELHDAGRERGLAAQGIHRPDPGQIRYVVRSSWPGRPGRVQGLLPVGDQRGYAKARRPGPRHGARPRHPVLRRAVGRAGPVTSRRLDDLILEIRDSLGATIVVVTHELPSIFAIGNNAVYLDMETKTITAQGNPRALRDTATDPKVHAFLTRGVLVAAVT